MMIFKRVFMVFLCFIDLACKHKNKLFVRLSLLFFLLEQHFSQFGFEKELLFTKGGLQVVHP